MKKILFILLILLVSCKSKTITLEKDINVLFIGNSLTYYHDMPKTLQAMLDENQSNLKIEQSTFPGMSLDSHLDNIITQRNDSTIYTRRKIEGEITETELKIKEKKWDIVVIQENPGAIHFPESVIEITNPMIERIVNLVDNKDCKFIIYKTWPSKPDYPIEKNCIPKNNFDYIKYPENTIETEKFCSPKINNLEEYIDLFNIGFNSIGEKFNFEVTNHANLHYKIIKKFPEINLYDDNYSHPSEIGSFLNALEFYRILSNKKISKLKYNGKLDKETSKKIKSIFN